MKWYFRQTVKWQNKDHDPLSTSPYEWLKSVGDIDVSDGDEVRDVDD